MVQRITISIPDFMYREIFGEEKPVNKSDFVLELMFLGNKVKQEALMKQVVKSESLNKEKLKQSTSKDLPAFLTPTLLSSLNGKNKFNDNFKEEKSNLTLARFLPQETIQQSGANMLYDDFDILYLNGYDPRKDKAMGKHNAS